MLASQPFPWWVECPGLALLPFCGMHVAAMRHEERACEATSTAASITSVPVCHSLPRSLHRYP